MTEVPIRLLLLEDNAGDARLVQTALTDCAPGEFAVVCAERLADAVARIRTEGFDAVLSDLGLPDSTGLVTAQAIVACAPGLPLVVLTGSHNQDLGREAIQHGAQDYLVKGESDGVLIARTLRYAIERKRLEGGLRMANEALERRVAERTAELEAAIKQLGASETRFRELTELTSDWYWEQDENLRFTWFSDGAMQHVGIDIAEYRGYTRHELPIDQVTEAQWAEHRRQTEAHLPFRDFQYRWTNRSGGQYYLSISGRPVFDEQGRFRGYRGVGRDVTERKKAELALARQKDLYGTLSQTNQLIVRGTGRDELFESVCRIAVEHGRFRFAWVGLIDNADQQVKQVAKYGDDAGYLGQLRLSMDESTAPGRSVTVGALRAGRRGVSNDFLDDPATAPWHEAAQRAGVRAFAAFPIRQGGAVIGAISFYAGEPGFFTDDLLATLDEMAVDVSFALDNFERESERKHAEALLRESEERLSAIFEGALDGILVADTESRIFVTGNPAICGMLGYTLQELGRIGVPDIHTQRDLPRVMEEFERLRRGESQLAVDIPVMRKDGSVFYADIKPAPIRLGGRNCLLGIFRDVTERRRAELALMRQKDLYNALSQTNQTIVRGVGREELFHAICRIAVEFGHFRFAWIGLIDRTDNRVRPAAQYGDDAGYVSQLDISIDESAPGGVGRTAQALRTGTRAVSNDLDDDRVQSPNRDAARRAGVRAYGAFPIRQDGTVVGVINFYSAEAGFFTEDLIATLEEMVQDLSFALDNIEREAERKRAQEALRESEARYRSVFANSSVTMLLIDPADGRIVDANRAACDYYGWDLPSLQGMSIKDLNTLAPEQVQAILDQQVPAVLDLIPEEQKIHFEFRHRLASGEVRDVEIFSGPVEIDGRKLLLSVIHDVTERLRAMRELAESEGRFRGLVEQSIAGTYIIQDGKFAYVNPRFAEIFGYASAEEVIGREAQSLVVEGERAAVADNVRRRTEGVAASISYDFTGVRKDGSTIHIGVHGARAIHRGRPAVIGLIQDISEKKRAEEQIRRYIAQLETAFMSTVQVATTLSEMRDPYTAGHERRVAEIAVAIGAELGFDARRQEGLRVAGYLHDVGKITIPSEILAKPGKLTAIEFELIRGHAQASYDVLKAVEFPWPVAEVALQHHERMDGSGYPQGLKGEAILLEARIMAVADTVEAMSSHRPYRPGLGIDKALAEIGRGRGTAYDAEVADACLRLFGEKGFAVPA